MKRFALLGVILAGGLAFGVYQLTHSSSQASSARPATPGSAVPQPTLPHAIEPTVPTAPATGSPAAMPSSRVDTTPAPEGGADVPAAAASGAEAAGTAETATGSAVQPHSTRAFKQRTAAGSAADDSPEAIRRAMNLRVQRAACQAPGIDQRYRRLDAAGRAKLKARCLEAGVVLADPK